MQNLEKTLEDYFSRRFGVDEKFWSKFRAFEKGESIWITSKDATLEESFVACGLRALRIGDKWLKPTTYVLQFLGKEIRRNVVDLSFEELKKLLEKRRIIMDTLNPGYVALRYEGKVLGCGLQVSRALKNRISKARTKELKKILETEDA